MIPRLLVRWTRVPVASDRSAWDSLFASVPAARRDRVVVPWDTGASLVVQAIARSARQMGFSRIRAERRRCGPPSEREVAALVRAGVNEIAFDAESAPNPQVVSAMRARLRHVVLVVHVPGAGDLGNPWLADELEVHTDGDPVRARAFVDALLSSARERFRRVSVRGVALCTLRFLDPRRVLSNSLVLKGPEGVLHLASEEPERVYYDVCGRCRLALACDGFEAASLLRPAGPRVRIRPFAAPGTRIVTLDAGGLARRAHPTTFLHGRVHLLSVAEGLRPAGRAAVSPENLSDQVALIREAGLEHEVVDVPPCDTDHARPGEIHVFFARTLEQARRVAAIERAFVSAERGPSPYGTAAFAWEMGRALGYPECCIEAFVSAGPRATTHDLLRRAHARSRAFSWLLNCLNPASPFPLIPHLPCRFDCEASIVLARAVHGLLDRLFPGLAGTARALLRRPCLLLGPDRAVALSGGMGATVSRAEYRLADPVGRAWGGQRAALRTLVLGQAVEVRGDWVVVTGRDGCERRLRGRGVLLFPFD